MTGRIASLFQALFWVALVRILLTTHSMKFVLRKFATRVDAPVPPTDLALARTAWAVRKASMLVPFASCLTQALAAQIILARSRYPSVIHIGVQKRGLEDFAAHAWLESEGRLLLGGTRATLSDFTQLATYSTASE